MLDALVGVAPLGFLLAAGVIIITPGPDMTLVARNTIADGRAAGLLTAAGALVGVSVHVVAAAAGLSAVLASSAEAFTVVKIAGAAYLVYLGVRTLWATRHGPADDDAALLGAATTPLALTPSSPLLQGLLSAVLNPKLAVFFLTFLPQFVDPENMPGLSMLAHGAVFVLMGAVWLTAWVLSLDRLSLWLRRSVVRMWIERATGVVLVALGVRLAFARNG
jgi:threonine/homoserine/homoserine lactone efflux protein